MYFVYILRCADGTLYTGITTDVLRRVAQHKMGKGAQYTKARGVDGLVYTEAHPNRSEASKREYEIKQWSRLRKLALVQK